MGKKLLILPLIPLLTFAVNVPQNFIDAYKQGREDEFISIKNQVQDLQKTIEGMLKFREYLIAGKIPPPIVVITKELRWAPSGLKAVKKIRIYFPSEVEFAQIEKLAVKLSSDYLPESGYYVYYDAQNLPDYAVGYLKLWLKKLNFKPFTFKNWLVAGVYQREADATSATRRINETLRKEGVLGPNEGFDYAFVEVVEVER